MIIAEVMSLSLIWASGTLQIAVHAGIGLFLYDNEYTNVIWVGNLYEIISGVPKLWIQTQ